MTIALDERVFPAAAPRLARLAAGARRALVPVLLLVAVALLVVAARGAWSALLGATRIEIVHVEGSFGERTRDAIRRSLEGLVAGQSLLDVPMRRVARELDALSWVASVDVYRVWPHGLVVRVTEKVPVARWNGDGFISHAGEVFQPESAGDTGRLPRLSGPADKAAQVMAFYQVANGMLLPMGLGIRELSLNPRLSWEIVTEGGMRIRVDQQDGASRLRRFLRVYEKHLAPVGARIDSVDLRYIGGFAVHWQPSGTTAMNVSTGAQARSGEDGQTQFQ